MKWEVVSISFLAVVAHAQLIWDYIDHHHRQLLRATSVAHWKPQVNFDYANSLLIASNYGDVGGNAIVGSWAYFQQPMQVPDRSRDFHFADLLSVTPVANVQVQGDEMAKANWMETATVVADKVVDVADPVRMKRKNILRYRNGEFRPTLCSPRLCLSYKPVRRI